MAQPPYVPQKGEADDPVSLRTQNSSVSYSSPSHVPRAWRANRPGDIADTGNPEASGFGSQGPDQGYLLKLAEGFSGTLVLTRGESEADAMAGCCRVALKRASIMGRAPMKEDLEISFMIFGFLYKNPPDELLKLRKVLLRGSSHSSDAFQSQPASSVSVEVLKLPPAEIKELQRRDWRLLFDGAET